MQTKLKLVWLASKSGFMVQAPGLLHSRHSLPSKAFLRFIYFIEPNFDMQNTMVGGTQLRGSYCDLCICAWNTMFMYLAQCCLIRKFLWLLLHFSLSQMVLISKCSGPQCSVKNDQESMRKQIWRSISGLYSCISRGKTLNYCKQMTGRVDLGWLIMKNVYNISVHAILQVGTCHLVFHSVWNSFL